MSGFLVLASDLAADGPVPLFRPLARPVSVRSRFTALRDGLDPFVSPMFSLDHEDGVVYADGLSAPGNQTRYSYLLLERWGLFRQGDSTVEHAPVDGLWGMTKWDACTVDARPGLYYVTAQDDRGRAAFLLGPFVRHLDALVRVQRAKAAALGRAPEAFWWKFGTSRVEPGAHDARVGVMNDVVLTPAETGILSERPDVLDASRLEPLASLTP